MLLNIRDKAQGWIAWAIVILISIPFALWGIQEYLGVGSEPVVAEVDGTEITEQQLERNIQRYRANLREQLGAAYDPEMLPDELVRQQVLDAMVRDLVLASTARDLGLRAGDDMVRDSIRNMAAFQRDGRFDNQAYESALRVQGFSPAAFEQSMRDDLATALLQSGIRGGALVTDLEIDDYVRVRDQTRDIALVRIEADAVLGDFTPDDEEIQSYYDANPGAFMRPERVKLRYLELDRNGIADGLEPDEQALVSYYDKHLAEYTSPEQRRLRHILITVDGEGDEADAQALSTASDLLERLTAGEDFAELAKAHSKDPGSAVQGGDLGLVEPGVMVPAFEEAAFALEAGALSEPVRTGFGYHLIRVDEIMPRGTLPFAQVRDRVDRAYRQAEAEQRYFSLAEQLTDITYESPESLEPAAEALGLEIQTSDWISREGGGSGILASPKVAAAAFEEDVLQRGYNSEPVEIDPTHMIVLRVLEHEEAAPRPLAEVREQILGILKSETAARKTAEQADQMREKVESAALDAVAAEYGLAVETHAAVTRTASELNPQLVRAVFAAGRPQQDAVIAHAVALPGADQALFVVRQVTDGDPSQLSESERAEVRTILERRREQQEYDLVIDQQVAESGIEYRRSSP